MKSYKSSNTSDMKHYVTGVVFSWRWWLLAAIIVLPWVFWLLWHQKHSTSRLLFVGFACIIVAFLVDALGTAFRLWEYPIEILPYMPPLIRWDTTLLPVSVMVFLQYKPDVNRIIKAAVFAALGAFMIEPGAELLGLYKPILWKHVYSFPFFAALYLSMDWLSRRGQFDLINTRNQ